MISNYKQQIYKENLITLKTFNLLSEEDKESKLIANVYICDDDFYLSFVFADVFENYIFFEKESKSKYQTLLDSIFIKSKNQESLSKGALYFWSHLFPLKTGFEYNNISPRKTKIVKFNQMPLNIAFLNRSNEILKNPIEVNEEINYDKEEIYILNNFIKGEERDSKFLYMNKNEEVQILSQEEISKYIKEVKEFDPIDMFKESIVYDYLFELISSNLMEKGKFFMRVINLDNSKKYIFKPNEDMTKLNVEENKNGR